MGAVFGHNWRQMQANDNFEELIITRPQSGWVYAPFHKSGRNIDLSQPTGDQRVLEIMSYSGRISAENGQGGRLN